jgi:hypothetical protein
MAKSQGNITKRKLKKLYPFLKAGKGEGADHILGLIWILLSVLVPLILTPAFPRAMDKLWVLVTDLESLYDLDMETIDPVKEMDAILKQLDVDHDNKESV